MDVCCAGVAIFIAADIHEVPMLPCVSNHDSRQSLTGTIPCTNVAGPASQAQRIWHRVRQVQRPALDRAPLTLLTRMLGTLGAHSAASRGAAPAHDAMGLADGVGRFNSRPDSAQARAHSGGVHPQARLGQPERASIIRQAYQRPDLPGPLGPRESAADESCHAVHALGAQHPQRPRSAALQPPRAHQPEVLDITGDSEPQDDLLDAHGSQSAPDAVLQSHAPDAHEGAASLNRRPDGPADTDGNTHVDGAAVDGERSWAADDMHAGPAAPGQTGMPAADTSDTADVDPYSDAAYYSQRPTRDCRGWYAKLRNLVDDTVQQMSACEADSEDYKVQRHPTAREHVCSIRAAGHPTCQFFCTHAVHLSCQPVCA